MGKIIIIVFVGVISSQFAIGSILGDTTQADAAKIAKRYLPHYIPIQYAGNIGFVSTGLGYVASRDKVHFSLQYGFTPESVGGIEIHALTFRSVFHLFRHPVRKSTFIPYASLGLSWDMGGRSFFFVPANMPTGYYKFPKSVHLIPSLGIKLRHPTKQIKALRSVELFAEAGTVDAYIWYKAISREVRMEQIMSLSVGVNLMRR